MSADAFAPFLGGLARVSGQAAVLVLVVLGIQALLRKQLAPQWRCALWLLVVARLLLPASFDSAASLFNLMPRWPERAVASIATPPAGSPGPASRPRVSRAPGEVRSPSGDDAVPPIPGAVPRVDDGQRLGVPAAAADMEPRVSPPIARPGVSWWAIGFGVWLAGVATLALQVAVLTYRLHRRLARVRVLEDAAVGRVLDECRARLGLRRSVEVAESAGIAGPALQGVFRPRLLLPAGFTGRFSPEEWRFVFLHELAHLKRHDLPLNWLMTGLQVVHWFNPLLWVGFARWRVDRELACDALALEAAGAGQRQAYGRTMVHLLEGLSDRATSPGLVGILEDRRQLAHRIRMILQFRSGPRWRALSVAVLTGLGVVCLTDAQAPRRAAGGGGMPGAGGREGTREERVGADPSETAVTQGESRTLVVTVRDAVTQRPVAGAQVLAPYAGDWRTLPPRRLTDAGGQFTLRFRIPPEGDRRQMSNFSVTALHPEYASRSVMWTSSSGDVYAGMPDGATIELERGVPVGGTVRDEGGAPIAGVRVLLSGSSYQGFTIGTDERKQHDYPEVRRTDKSEPAAVTDAAGRWTYPHFPSDLHQVEVTFVRPDDSPWVFATASGETWGRSRPRIALEALRAGTADTTLPEGLTVRGRVLDEAGRPLAGVTVREGFGFGNIARTGETVTDAQGWFERPHRVPRQWIYTATAPGRATASVVAQVEPGLGEVRIVLPPDRPVRLRVVDVTGQPLEGVELRIDSVRTEAQLLDWTATTGPDGVAVWTNAPTQPAMLLASKSSPPLARKFRVDPGSPNVKVVLDPAMAEQIVVRGRAVDAVTRAPVTVRSVAARYEGNSTEFAALAAPKAAEFAVTIRRTDFRVGMYPSYALRFDADGYDSATLETRDFDLGDQEIEVVLTRSDAAAAVAILQPDGTPANGARVWIQPERSAGNLFINLPGRYYGDRLTQAEADAEGRLRLPAAPAEAPLFLAHANGCLESTVGKLRRAREVRLQPYAAVEGRLLVGGQPKPSTSVSLTTLVWSPARVPHVSYLTTTDTEGRFAFTQVPAGEYKLYRWNTSATRRPGPRAITETCQFPVTVRAGETNRVEYGFRGRAVRGVARPDPSEVAVDWQHDDHVLALNATRSAGPKAPNFEDYATREALEQAHQAAYTDGARRDEARQARTFQLSFEPDGSFQVDDVPPGTYELRIKVTKPTADERRVPFGRPEDELGSLTRAVVVPEGSGPLDLGELVVAIRGADVAPARPPLEFTVRGLGGETIRLADFRGRPVVLVFWAAWSERSLDALTAVTEARKGLGDAARLAVLGLNLDEDAATARRAARERGCDWPQAWLDDAARAELTAALDANTLPAIYVLSAQGRVTQRDVGVDRLAAALKRALAQP